MLMTPRGESANRTDAYSEARERGTRPAERGRERDAEEEEGRGGRCAYAEEVG